MTLTLTEQHSKECELMRRYMGWHHSVRTERGNVKWYFESKGPRA